MITVRTGFLTKERKLQRKEIEADIIISNDTNRSFTHYEDKEEYGGEKLEEKKLELKAVIHSVIESTKGTSYYQGLNFIAETFYVEYGMVKAFLIVRELAKYVFDSYLAGNKSFDSELNKKMGYTLAVLEQEIADFEETINFDVSSSEKSNPMSKLNFAVSWYLTYFAYKIHDPKKVLQIFDYLVSAQNPFAISYLVAAFVKEVYRLNNVSKNSEKHMLMNVLFNGKFNDLELEKVFDDAFYLMSHEDYQIEVLNKQIEKKNKFSVLKDIKNGFLGIFKKK